MTGYQYPSESYLSDQISEEQIPYRFHEEISTREGELRMLSLFSGCGGMDLGFEGNFLAHRKSFPQSASFVEQTLDNNWVLVQKTRFRTVFANDILPEARIAWVNYMKRLGHDVNIYHTQSIVDLVKMQQQGADIFPKNIDIVTGGFPCQDFSIAGKRLGFNSKKDDKGKLRSEDQDENESRGKLYTWMKQVIELTLPKVFVAENVKGLVNLGNVKDIIQEDFSTAGSGYIVLPPQVLHAGNYGVPESRERVFFIGLRRDALRLEVLRALESEKIPNEYNPYPLPTHACTFEDGALLSPVTTGDVFINLSEPDQSIDPSQKTYSKAKYMSNGSQGQIEIKLDCIGPTIRSEHHGNIEFRRLSEEHGGKYLNELSKGLKERRLTPRECALIQTFPPDYPFVTEHQKQKGRSLSASGAYKVIGNAVPPILAYHIAKRLEELWSTYFKE